MDIKVMLLVVLLPIGAFSQLACYRCFGNSYCNHPLDVNSSAQVTCQGDNATFACMTTHYVEERETYTMRVCVNNVNTANITTCERVRTSIFGATGNSTGFHCSTCTTDLCNTGTSIPQTGGSINTKVSYFTVIIVTLFACIMK